MGGGIGCKVSFFMIVALLIVAGVIGAFFYWEAKNSLNAEIRGRAMYPASELSALTAENVITGNRFEI